MSWPFADVILQCCILQGTWAYKDLDTHRDPIPPRTPRDDHMSSFNHAFCCNELSSSPWKWRMLMNGVFQHSAGWKHLLCVSHLELARLLMPLYHINVSQRGHLLIRRGARGCFPDVVIFHGSHTDVSDPGSQRLRKACGRLSVQEHREITCLLCLTPSSNVCDLSPPLQWFFM